MYLTRLTLCAGLSFVVSSSTTIGAQSTPSARTDIRPFVTVSVGPGTAQTGVNARGNKDGSDRPILDASAGARKRVVGKFGLIVSANVGKVVDHELIGGDLTCRVQIVDGKPSSCLPADPLLDWFGISAGGEAYLGRAILGVQVGPASFGTKAYERNPETGAKSGRELGVRYQFDANFPIYRVLGVTLSAAHRHVPAILGDQMNVTSLGAGLTIRAFR